LLAAEIVQAELPLPLFSVYQLGCGQAEIRGFIPNTQQMCWTQGVHLLVSLSVPTMGNLRTVQVIVADSVPKRKKTAKDGGELALRRLCPTPQHFGHAPGLSDAPSGGEGGIGIEDFADRAYANLC
jgi:hypothetical protein